MAHVFFRDSTGQAYLRNDGKHTPTNLLSTMGKLSFLDGDHVAWKIWPHQYDALFSSFITLDRDRDELNVYDSKEIIWKALGDVAKTAPGKPLDATAVLKAGNHHAAAFFRQPFTNYSLVTSLSVNSLPAKRITVRGSVITSLSTRGKRYPLPKVLESESHRHRFAEHLNSSSYQLIRVCTKGRSIFEGVRRALDDLNLLRALWSLVATLGRWTTRFAGRPRRPIGVIHTGPVYTLHNMDGSAANDDYYWFDPDYTADLELFMQDHRWPQIERDRRWALKQMSRLPYGKELEELFARYVAALDQPNPNVAFLQLWSILEKLTDTVGAQYDKTIERSCWVYSKRDRPVMKETLDALRHHRNRYVHSGSAGQETEEITNLIKSFVDPHLVRLLNNNFKVHNFREYGEFLSYPTDIKTLERRLAWTSQALRVAREDESQPPADN